MSTQSSSTNDTLHTLQDLKCAFAGLAGDDDQVLFGPNVTSDDINAAMRDLRQSLQTTAGLSDWDMHMRRVDSVMDKIDGVVDPLTQLHPLIAPIVWGSVKVLVKVAKGRADAFEAIIDSFIIIADNLPRICIYGSSRRTDHWDTATSSAFREIVKFLITAANFFQKSKLKQMIHGSSLSAKIKEARNNLVESFRSAHFEQLTKEFKAATQQWEENRFRKVLRHLRAVNFEADFAKYRRARLRDTCKWSVNHPVIGPWITARAPKASHLWIYGNPGTGKSTLAAYLIEEAERVASPDAIVLYFFGDNKDHGNDKQKAESILRTFIRQILVKYPTYVEISKRLVREILSHEKDYEFSFEDLMGHLMPLIKSFTRSRIIIDGLDECQEKITEHNGLVGTLADTPGVQLLVLSRPETYIQNHLNGWTKVKLGGDVTTQEDIRTYISEKVDELVTEIGHPEIEKDDLKAVLLKASGDMFLYVRLAVQNVLDRERLLNDNIQDLLRNPPQDLDKLYEQYLLTRLRGNNKRHNEIAIRALQWVLYSQRAVTRNVMRLALAIDPDDGGLDPSKLYADVRVTEAALGRALGILLDWQRSEDHISLMHQSLRDYLLRPTDRAKLPEELRVLYDFTRPDRAHTQLLTTCCIVLRSPAVGDPLREYYDSADRRWRLHEKRHGRLEQQLCEREGWDKWEDRQFRDVHKEWQWREEEEKLIREALETLGDELTPEWREEQAGKLQLLREMKNQKSAEIRGLTALSCLRERELMIYAFRHLPDHLAGAARQGNRIQIAASFIEFLDTFLRQIKLHASSVAENVVVSQTPPSLRHVASVVDLANALQSLVKTVSDIDALIHADVTRGCTWLYLLTPTIRSLLRDSHTHYPTIRPETIWDTAVVQSLEETKSSPRVKHLFALVTLALANLRNAELALYSFDEHMPASLGTSNLVYDLRHTAQMLAQWMVLRSCDDPGQHERLEFLIEDDFLDPALLQKNVKFEVEPEQCGVLLLDKELWKHHSIYLSFAWLLCFTVGAINSQRLWIVAIFVAVCSEGHQYSFQNSDTSFAHRTTHSFPPFFLAGWLLSACCDFGCLFVVAGIIGLVYIFHATNLVRLCFRFTAQGRLRFEIEGADERFVALVASAISYQTAWFGIAVAIVAGDRSVNATLNLGAVYFAIYKILAMVIDPTGLQRALVQLRRLGVQTQFSPPIDCDNHTAITTALK